MRDGIIATAFIDSVSSVGRELSSANKKRGPEPTLTLIATLVYRWLAGTAGCRGSEEPGSAIEAGAPEFIDLLTSENTELQATLGGGMKWLETTCSTRNGKAYLDCTAEQQKAILDQIAFRKNFEQDPALLEPIEFFILLRNMTADAFFTSKIGIKYLGYKGNTFLTEFPGCPPVPGI